MKKILLSAMALVAAMSVSAQEYSVFAEGNPDFDALGLNSDGVALTAGTVIGQSENIVFKIGGDDTYKPQNRGTITVGDIAFKGGLQGSTNPQGATGAPANALETPISGAYFEIEAKSNGYLYVFQWASSNKAYTVFEEGEAVGFIYSAVGDASTALGAQYGFVLEGAGEYNWLKEAGYAKMLWPEQIYLKWDGDTENNPWTNISKNGLCVIKFPVFEGCKYAINANGSKMTAIGYYFDKTGDATVKATQDDVEYTLLNNGSLDGSTPQPGGETSETDLTLTEGHTLLVSDIEAAGGTDEDIVRFYIKNGSGESREGWGIGGFANSDNWTPSVEWTGVAGDSWTYEYTVAQIKATAGDAPGQYHGIGITINIYNGCTVDKVTLVKGGSTAIQSAKAQAKAGIRYNLAGQKVDANYKGIVIENGKKMMVK